ncbi:MAG TPA: hypothetical protein VF168_10730 [Trueperaceae bacterium]
MISRSRRQRENVPASRDLDAHNRLARARDRHRHLFRGALLALAAAIVGWLLGFDLTVRAVSVAAAFALAWLVPLRGSTEWALRWISDRAGLAYQTALEIGDGEDPYGFAPAVAARADASLARVERPEHSAWWLPLLALALGVLLLPALPLSGEGGSLGGQLPPGATVPAPAAGEDSDEEAEEPVPNLPGEETTRLGRTPDGSPDEEQGEEAEAQGDGQGGEREALERYLQGIRERPESLAEEQDAGDEQGAGRTPAGAAPRPGQERPGGQGERRSGEGQPGEGEGDRPAEQGGNEGEEPGESGGQGGRQEPRNPFAPAGSNENEDSGEQLPGEGEQPEGGGPGEERLEEGGDEPAAGPGESPAGAEQQGQGQGAGALPSAQQDAGRAGQLGGENLQLRGELREGPLSEGGTIQLPGGDEVQLPAGRAPGEYAREVESAVTEGRIPLEYQEIIRNYFR